MPPKKATTGQIKTSRNLEQEQLDEIEALTSIYTEQIEVKKIKDKKTNDSVYAIHLKILPSQVFSEEEDSLPNSPPSDAPLVKKLKLEITLNVQLPRYYPLVKPYFDLVNYASEHITQVDRDKLMQLLEDKVDELSKCEEVMIFEMYEVCKNFIDEKLESINELEQMKLGKSFYDEMQERLKLEEEKAKITEKWRQEKKLEDDKVRMKEVQREILLMEGQKREKMREKERRRKALTQGRLPMDDNPVGLLEMEDDDIYYLGSLPQGISDSDSDIQTQPKEFSPPKLDIQPVSPNNDVMNDHVLLNSDNPTQHIQRTKSSGWFAIDDSDSNESDSDETESSNDDESDETESSNDDDDDEEINANDECKGSLYDDDLNDTVLRGNQKYFSDESIGSVSSSVPSAGGAGSPIWSTFGKMATQHGITQQILQKQQLLIVHMVRKLVKNSNENSPEVFNNCIYQLEKAGLLNLQDLGMFWSDKMTNDKVFEAQKFYESFNSTFQEQIKQSVSSPLAQLWTPELNDNQFGGNETKSRYENDYEEICELGRGGFGCVVKARNKLDSRIYAVKKVRFSGNLSEQEEKKILREVNLLSHLHHDNIVRYYNAWRENITGGELVMIEESASDEDEDLDALDEASFSEFNYRTTTNHDRFDTLSTKVSSPSRVMYITMEYCKSTLHHLLSSEAIQTKSKAQIWEMIRGILEGLVYIHSRSIIHRDLKPANIFISQDNELKLGDFGLARKGVKRRTTNILVEELAQSRDSIARSESQDLSQEVGTPIYSSPEIETCSTYDSRVDMYSLGIIFFEVCMRRNGFFNSLHERADEILKLRETGKVPDSFPKTWEDCAKVIELLIQKDPSKRPTAQQLLESGLIPVSLQREELSKAFMRVKRDIVKLPKKLNTRKLFQREMLVNRCKYIFQQHGAVQYDMSAIIPYSEQTVSMQQQHRDKFSPLVFPSNNLVCTPYDLHSHYARLLSRLPTPPDFLKRYSFDQIYKESKEETAVIKTLMCFDIVGTKSGCVTDAEVLKVSAQILQTMTTKKSSNNQQKFVIRINHTSILGGIMKLCNLQDEDILYTLDVLRNKRKYGYNRSKVTSLLEEGEIPANSISQLRNFLISEKESPMEVHKLLSRKLPPTDVRDGLKDIIKLLGLLETWSLGDVTLVFDPLYAHKLYKRYTGIDFQIELMTPRSNRKKMEVLGYGGRFDNLVDSFSVIPTSQGKTKVVGVCFFVDRLFRYLQLRPELSSSNSFHCWSTGSPDVIITSVGSTMLEERMRIANYFWDCGIKADLVYDERISLQYINTYCINHDIEWVVTVRHSNKNVVKLTRIQAEKSKKRKDIPQEMRIEEFVTFLRNDANDPSHGSVIHTSTGADINHVIQDPELLKTVELFSVSRITTKQKQSTQSTVLSKFAEYYKTFPQKTKLIAVLDHIKEQEIQEILQLFPSDQKLQEYIHSRGNKKNAAVLQSLWKSMKEAQGQKKQICFYLTSESRFIVYNLQ